MTKLIRDTPVLVYMLQSLHCQQFNNSILTAVKQYSGILSRLTFSFSEPESVPRRSTGLRTGWLFLLPVSLTA